MVVLRPWYTWSHTWTLNLKARCLKVQYENRFLQRANDQLRCTTKLMRYRCTARGTYSLLLLFLLLLLLFFFPLRLLPFPLLLPLHPLSSPSSPSSSSLCTHSSALFISLYRTDCVYDYTWIQNTIYFIFVHRSGVHQHLPCYLVLLPATSNIFCCFSASVEMLGTVVGVNNKDSIRKSSRSQVWYSQETTETSLQGMFVEAQYSTISWA